MSEDKYTDEVLEFINRRWKDTDAHWLDRNHYWFALILIMRFPYLKLYYLPVEEHFVAGTPSRYYDIGGRNVSKEKPELFEVIHKMDPLLAARILHNCAD